MAQGGQQSLRTEDRGPRSALDGDAAPCVRCHDVTPDEALGVGRPGALLPAVLAETATANLGDIWPHLKDSMPTALTPQIPASLSAEKMPGWGH